MLRCTVMLKAVNLLATGSPSLKEVYADYLTNLPRYRDIPDLSGISCIRPFFGFVPNWHDTPLKPITSRLLHIGDSAGNRSALSFAGKSLSFIWDVSPFKGKLEWFRHCMGVTCSVVPLDGDAPGDSVCMLRCAGFGSMARHLPRLTEGLAFALESNQTSRGALELLQPKSPAISMTAAMQVILMTLCAL